MQKANDVIFDGVQLLHVAQRLNELQAEKVDIERTLREIKAEIAETEARLSEAMESQGDWLSALVCVFKKRKGGGAGV